jgi:hypothetical protein
MLLLDLWIQLLCGWMELGALVDAWPNFTGIKVGQMQSLFLLFDYLEALFINR